jgi:hypothetical protein
VKLTITIDCDNDAFDQPGDEIARILRGVAGVVEGESKLSLLQSYSGRLYDRKLNHVGELNFTEPEGGAPSA